MSSTTTVEKLYELCDAIDAAKDKSQCGDEFNTILSGTKGGASEKKFASQLIVRFFHHFPDTNDQALEAMFELCEDDDVNIRKSVIKELPSLCKDGGKHVAKIADVLVQLLQTEDTQEYQIVNNALSALLSNHAKETLTTLFGHILNPDADLIRERAVKFVTIKMKTLPESVVTKEIEDFVLQESKKVLQEANGDEFILFMNMLSQFRTLHTVQGRQLLLDIITEQADLDKAFDPEDPDRLDQIVQCVKQAIPFMSKNVHSTKFITFVIDNAIPVLSNIKGEDAARLELLRLTADLSTYSGDLPDSTPKMDIIEHALMTYLPVPPSESAAAAVVDEGQNGAGGNTNNNDNNNAATAAATATAESEATTTEGEPNLQFSEIECLIYTLHQLGRRHPQYLTSADKAEAVKELKKRLQYLARVIQVYSSRLRKALLSKGKEEMKTEAYRIKNMALKTTQNISNLVKDLLHIPPSYKAVVTLSWKPAEAKAAAVAGQKRLSEQSVGESSPANKNPKRSVEIYQPPSGKFSEKAGNFERPDTTTTTATVTSSGGTGGRGGGGFRGRGGFRGGFRGGRGGGRGFRGRWNNRSSY